jgi:NitT/TauT family transport system substrate-binding protein
LSAGHIEVGWAAPPFGIDKIDDGVIRVIGRANDMTKIRNKTVGVIITNADTLEKRKAVLVRFMQAYAETIDWMYTDPAALQRFAATSGVSEGVARRLRDEFFPKEMLLPNRIVGLKEVVKDAVVLDYIHTALSRKQIATLVQIVTPEPSGRWQVLRRIRDRLR